MENQTQNQTILIVDDDPDMLDLLCDVLEDYPCDTATNGDAALEKAASPNPPDLIVMDVLMPGLDGYEICRQLRANSATRNIPVIMVTGMTQEKDAAKAFEVGAVDYIAKPISPVVVRARVHMHLQLTSMRNDLRKQHETVNKKTKMRTRELEMTHEATILSMAALAETRDNETGGHVRRIQHYARALAMHLRHDVQFSPYLNLATIELVYKAAPLHDIGKVGVRDSILLKPGRLTTAEFDEMKRHTILGRDAILKAEEMLGGNPFLTIASEICYTHHEKWNGTGYPQGLKEEQIPVWGRLVGLADVYDALISKRVYKPPFPHEDAVQIIYEGKGKHFDPDVVDAFLVLQNRFRSIALKFADFDEERQVLSKYAT